jgi:ribosomal protein L24
VPDQPFSAPTNKGSEETHDGVQIGDIAEVVSGTHTGLSGTVEMISSDMVQIWPSAASHPRVIVHLKFANFSPPSNALIHSADRGCNVKPGDPVMVVRGSRMGMKGIVRTINLQQKILEVCPSGEFVCISPLLAWFTNLFTRTVSLYPVSSCPSHTLRTTM